MRALVGMLVISASALTLAACNKPKDAKPPAAAGEAPAAAGPLDLSATHRKPGLWKQTVTSAGVSQTMRLCTDAATEQKFAVWGGQASKDMCSEQKLTRGLGGEINFTSVCDMGTGGKTTTEGVMKGDFKTRYTVEAKTVTTGAGAPQMNGEHAMTMEAVWEGPCPADFKPGDMEIAQGVKFNILEMNAGAAAGH